MADNDGNVLSLAASRPLIAEKSKLSKVFGSFSGRRLIFSKVWIVVSIFFRCRYSSTIPTASICSSVSSCSSASLANSVEEKSSFRIWLLFSTVSKTESFIPVHLLVEVKLFKGKARFRLREPHNRCFYWHSREFFWLL